jgi:hypothetical protein
VNLDDIAHWLAQRQPRNLDPATWAAVRGFVNECTLMAKPVNIEGAARISRVLRNLAVWCLSEGLPLDREVILDPAVVERFITVSEAHSRSRATDRWQLRKIGPILTTQAPWEPRPVPVSRLSVVPPYSATEMRQLRADAARQSTALRRQAARTLVVLGAGAGLDGRWVARVRPSDVTVVDGVVLVRVGNPMARVVPVLGEFEDDVLDLAATCTTGALIGVPSTSRGRVSVICARLTVAHGHPPFSANRFRSTWLARHLDLGTRLSELKEAAGLKTIAHLSDLLPHLPPLVVDEAHQMLRGPS